MCKKLCIYFAYFDSCNRFVIFILCSHTGFFRMADDEAPSSPLSFKTPEEKLLYHSRIGDYQSVAELLNLRCEGRLDIDINCKGNCQV